MTNVAANIAGIKQTQPTLLSEVDALIQPIRKAIASARVCVTVCVNNFALCITFYQTLSNLDMCV